MSTDTYGIRIEKKEGKKMKLHLNIFKILEHTTIYCMM